MSDKQLTIRNGQARELADVPRLETDAFRQAVIQAVRDGARIAAFSGDAQAEGRVRLMALLADDQAGQLSILATEVGKEYPSLTPECPQAQLFEREIYEQTGVVPTGHPWLKPVRFPSKAKHEQGASFTPNSELRTSDSAVGVIDFFHASGDEMHEVAVGPVHAGVIEPGHFRFQCHGEDVLHLEISLGYQHRGVERAMVGGPSARTYQYSQTLAGDSTIAHTTAYCHAMEALSGCQASPRALALRGVALELERVANHVGDLGALAGDVGFLPTMSFCGRLRGDILNLTASLCGNRLGRGLVVPGGVAFDVDERLAPDLLSRIEAANKDIAQAVNLLWDSPSVTARFEGTGVVTADTAREIGLVGPAARASGIEMDVRTHHPLGIWHFVQIPLSAWDSGDVYARAQVRWLEIQRSLAFVTDQLRSLPKSPLRTTMKGLAPNKLAIAMIEGWRGEVCHVVRTDADGRIRRYKVVDPSFHNWFGLAMSLRGGQISDFPLCNKSFNLSYCGHDL